MRATVYRVALAAKITLLNGVEKFVERVDEFGDRFTILLGGIAHDDHVFLIRVVCGVSLFDALSDFRDFDESVLVVTIRLIPLHNAIGFRFGRVIRVAHMNVCSPISLCPLSV